MTKAAFDRLRKEFARLVKAPPPLIEAVPLESNILEWHYVLTGPPNSPYEGGVYTGKLIFPPQYPFKPPSILMTTPSGRFKTDTRLCLSMSDFHPESWQPLWSVASLLIGLQSFMLESTPTLGSIETSDEVKREYAQRSLEYNLRLPTFRKLFPKYVQRAASEAEQRATEKAGPESSAAANSTAASLTQRRGTTEAAAAPLAPPPVGGDIAVPDLGLAPPRMLEFFGVKIQEKSVFDLLVMLIVLGTLIFAAVFMSNK